MTRTAASLEHLSAEETGSLNDFVAHRRQVRGLERWPWFGLLADRAGIGVATLGDLAPLLVM